MEVLHSGLIMTGAELESILVMSVSAKTAVANLFLSKTNSYSSDLLPTLLGSARSATPICTSGPYHSEKTCIKSAPIVVLTMTATPTRSAATRPPISRWNFTYDIVPEDSKPGELAGEKVERGIHT